MLATVSEESGISSAISADAEGIYLPLADGKDHSCELYEKAIESFAGKNVIVGLCSPRDERGNFGVRYFLENRDVLKFELREILRGADRGELALAVSGAVYPEEIRRVRAVLVETASELKNEGVSYGERLRLGAIIDTPAAALCGELIASEVDLFVVDSDALSSLALDADRKFPTSADVVKRNPEPTLRLIEMAAKAIHSSGKGKLVGVSGDMAFDRSLTERLAGIGVDFMSVPPPYILEMRERIRECQE
jgi:phosphotransferase system enzyme I (PtsI)